MRLDLHPRTLAHWVLAAPVVSGANLIALEPVPMGAPPPNPVAVEAPPPNPGQPDDDEDWSLTLKRGTRTIGAFRVGSEVGAAAVVLLASVAQIDLLALTATSSDGSTAGRVRVRAGREAGEVLLSILLRPTGLALEARSLDIGRAAPRASSRSLLRRCPACGAIVAARADVCSEDGAALEDVVESAEPFGFLGVYHLKEVLGRGAMGVVLAAEHVFLGHQVAVKVLHASADDDPARARRFLEEARLAAGLKHPSIAQVIDYGVLADGRSYLIMERVDGASLADVLRRGPMQPATALRYAREIAVALEAAHERGVVHLDLKPQNVLVLEASRDDAPRIKLIDFGAAARGGFTAAEGQLVGTPAYMAPEHARGEPVDARTDIYALGVALHEALTGKLPFDLPDPWDVMLAHMRTPAPPVVTPSGPAPRAAQRVVARALAKRPEERYQTANEMVADIDLALASLRRGARLPWLA